MHVLIIDDEVAVRQVLAAAVTKGGHTVEQAATVAEATAKLALGDVDVALCDIRLPDGNGIELVRRARTGGIETAFIMVTALTSIETAVEALRAGAADYVIKPVHNEELLHRLTQVGELGGLKEQNTALRRAVSERSPKLFRFECSAMREVDRLVAKVATTQSTVLVTGESGTGKGVVARQIHEMSGRQSSPFVSVNCSAIPENLMESEFFGHSRGAFTGADHSRKGLFVQAHRGTLFLDEIGELPMHMQAKLLSALEDKEIRPIGTEQVRRVDVRIIAATNRNLEERVEQGAFREDLYFRLSMFQIPMPALRDRASDLPGLLRFMLARPGSSSGTEVRYCLDPLAEEALLAYSWPGNVRQLDNVVSRACILADDNCISLSDLPAEVVKSASNVSGAASLASPGASLRDQMRQMEREVLERAILEADGDRRAAALNLGIGLSTLYRKLEESKGN